MRPNVSHRLRSSRQRRSNRIILRKSSWTGIYRINRMMRFIVDANSFAHQALNRRMNSPLSSSPTAGFRTIGLIPIPMPFGDNTRVCRKSQAGCRACMGIPGRRERIPENRCDPIHRVEAAMEWVENRGRSHASVPPSETLRMAGHRPEPNPAGRQLPVSSLGTGGSA